MLLRRISGIVTLLLLIGGAASVSLPDSSSALPGKRTEKVRINLTVVALSDAVIELTWTVPNSRFRSFSIERSSSVDADFTVVAVVHRSSRTYSDSGLTPRTTYFYRVSGGTEKRDAAYSTVASARTLGEVSSTTSPPETTLPTSTSTSTSTTTTASTSSF